MDIISLEPEARGLNLSTETMNRSVLTNLINVPIILGMSGNAVMAFIFGIVIRGHRSWGHCLRV